MRSAGKPASKTTARGWVSNGHELRAMRMKPKSALVGWPERVDKF